MKTNIAMGCCNSPYSQAAHKLIWPGPEEERPPTTLLILWRWRFHSIDGGWSSSSGKACVDLKSLCGEDEGVPASAAGRPPRRASLCHGDTLPFPVSLNLLNRWSSLARGGSKPCLSICEQPLPLPPAAATWQQLTGLTKDEAADPESIRQSSADL